MRSMLRMGALICALTLALRMQELMLIHYNSRSKVF
ncbi:hypothetical protein DSUL_50222 [Desulfovibrionales bacterium]